MSFFDPQHQLSRTLLAVVCGLTLLQCRPDPMPNPYDDIDEVQTVIDATAPIPEGTFAWLHDRMFQPTCANSGCHDGTFEPDFRTINSAWNTLVWHPVISNDAAGSFEFRVVPQDVAGSLLIERLTTFIPNTSGMMPLSVDPGSDWNDNKTAYLEALETWIENGALDVNGNEPVIGDLSPQITGFGGFPSGNLTDPYPRNPDANYRLEVEAGPVDLWFAINDDSTPLDALVAGLRMAASPDSLAQAPAWEMDQPFTFDAANFFGGTSTYSHRVTLDLTGFPSESTWYLLATVDDGTNAIAIPGPGSQPYLIPLYSIYIP